MPLFKSVKKFLTQPACGCKKTRKRIRSGRRKVIRKSYVKKKYGGYSYSSKGSSRGPSVKSKKL